MLSTPVGAIPDSPNWGQTPRSPISMKLLILVLLAAALGPAQSAVHVSSPEEIKQDFDAVPCKNKDRLRSVRALFEKMGAHASDISVQKLNGKQNLIVRLPGSTDERIVIGAHYDLIERGCGAIDNWTGIVTVAHSFRTIQQLGNKKSVLFVAFDQEEKGLLGSHEMVKAITEKDLSKYCAMINVDSFGLARPFAMTNVSSPSLVTLAEEVAASLQLSLDVAAIPQGDTDSSSFLKRGIPAVTLSGMTKDWPTILHTPRDQSSLIIPESVYAGYRMVLSMWDRIDRKPCQAFR